MTIRSRLARAPALVAAAMLAAPIALSPMMATPAHAQSDRLRSDATMRRTSCTAARALEQINNQITSLQNEAQMLINQARNLASLPYSSLQQLQQSVQRTQQLLGQAQRIAFDVQQIDQAFQQQPTATPRLSASDQQLVAGARERWQNTVGGLQDAMRVQAGVVGNIDTNRDADVGAGRRRARARPARCRRRRPATSFSRSRRSSSPTSPPWSPRTAGRRRSSGRAGGRRRTGPRAAPPLPDAGRRLPARQRPACSRTATEGEASWTARCSPGSAPSSFVAVAITATAIELDAAKDEPAAASAIVGRPRAPTRRSAARRRCDRCQQLGRSRRRAMPTCLRAWAENRRRFLAPGSRPTPHRQSHAGGR